MFASHALSETPELLYDVASTISCEAFDALRFSAKCFLKSLPALAAIVPIEFQLGPVHAMLVGPVG